MELSTLCALVGLSPQSTAEALRLEAWGHDRGEIIEDVPELKKKFEEAGRAQASVRSR